MEKNIGAALHYLLILHVFEKDDSNFK